MPTHAISAAAGGESWLQTAKKAFWRLCGELSAAFRELVAKRLFSPTHLLALLVDARFKRLKMLSEPERTHAFHVAKRRLQTICLANTPGSCGAEATKTPTPDAHPNPNPSPTHSRQNASSIEHPLAEFCEEHPVTAAPASAAPSISTAAAHAAEAALMEYLSALPPLSIDGDVHQFWAHASPLAPAASAAASTSPSASASWAAGGAGASSERHLGLVRELAAEVLCVPAVCRSCSGDWHSECAPLKTRMEAAAPKQTTAAEIVELTEKLLYLQSNQHLIRL